MSGPLYYDRVRETTTTTGTGTLTLAGAVSGFRSFSVVGNGNTCHYCIESDAGDWEVGLGTYTSSGTTLARTTVLASSNSGSAVNLPAGTKRVFLTLPADRVSVLVVGPGSATDNALARFDLTTGKLLQDSTMTVDDSGNAAVSGKLGVGGVTASNTLHVQSSGGVTARFQPSSSSTSCLFALYDGPDAANSFNVLFGVDPSGGGSGFVGASLVAGKNGTGTARAITIGNFDAQALKFTTAAATRGQIDGGGNWMVGTGTVPSGGGVPVLALTQASGNPTGIGTNTAGLVAKDNGGTCELYAWDEAGNVTQLSPHAMDGPAWLYDADDPLPRVLKEENVYLGYRRWTNESRQAALLQRMMAGENLALLPERQRTFVHVERFVPQADWSANQQANAARRNREIAEQLARKAEVEAGGGVFMEEPIRPHAPKPEPPLLARRRK